MDVWTWLGQGMRGELGDWDWRIYTLMCKTDALGSLLYRTGSSAQCWASGWCCPWSPAGDLGATLRSPVCPPCHCAVASQMRRAPGPRCQSGSRVQLEPWELTHSISNELRSISDQIRAGSDDIVQVNRIPAGTPVFGGPVCALVGVEGVGWLLQGSFWVCNSGGWVRGPREQCLWRQEGRRVMGAQWRLEPRASAPWNSRLSSGLPDLPRELSPPSGIWAPLSLKSHEEVLGGSFWGTLLSDSQERQKGLLWK